MIKVGTRVKVTDNTGALIAQVIGIIKGGRQRFVRPGRVVKVTIKKARPDGNVHEHEVHYALVVRTKKEYKREDCTTIRFDDNAVVLIDPETKEPKGTRIFGPIAREVKLYGFDKVTQLAEEVL